MDFRTFSGPFHDPSTYRAAVATRVSLPPTLPSTRVYRPATGFLHLPLEIRLQIYEYCIPQGQTVSVLTSSIRFESKGILLVCRQIANEALDILFEKNVFEIPLNAEGELFLRQNFHPRNRRRMRSLRITAVPIGKSYDRSSPDRSLWSTMMPRLRYLEIIASQPVPPHSYMEGALRRWASWIVPYFEVFTRHLQRSATVLVDVDDRRTTLSLAKEYLPSSSQMVPLKWGDLIFLRGAYAHHAEQYAIVRRRPRRA